MMLRDYSPSQALRSVVQCFRIVDFDFTAFSSVPHKIYAPRPEVCLHVCVEGHIAICYAGNDLEIFRDPVLVGQHTRPFARYSTHRLLNFQIVFEPAGVYELLGINSSLIVNRHVPAREILGPPVVELREHMKERPGYSEMISIAEAFVTRLLFQSRYPNEKFNRLITASKSHTFTKVDDLAAASSFSEKQFQRKFAERTGVNPKTFLRLSRFSQAYYLKSRFPEKDWLQIALMTGYHDYPHLVRDYKKFTGQTPNDFHLMDRKAPEFVLGLDKELYQNRISITF